MNIKDINEILVQSIGNLDIKCLNDIDEKISYSYNNKNELIESFKVLFEELKSKGITSLDVQSSKCNFCYPDKDAYAFYNPTTNDLVLRYVIFQESPDFYRVEECKNKLNILLTQNLPF